MALQYDPVSGEMSNPKGDLSYNPDELFSPFSDPSNRDRFQFGGKQYVPYDPSFWTPESFYGQEELFAPFRDQLSSNLITGPDGKQYVSGELYDQAQGTLFPFSRGAQKNIGPASVFSRGLGLISDENAAKLDKYDAIYQAAERGYGPYVGMAAVGAAGAAGLGAGAGAAGAEAGAVGAGAGAGTAASGSAPLLTTVAPVGTALPAGAAGGGIGLGEVAAGAGLVGTGAEALGSDTPPPQDTAPPGGYQMGPEGEAFMNRPTTGTGGSSALGRLLGLGQTGEDVLSVGGSLLPALLGYLGADKQSDAYRDVSNQYLALGAPYRSTLEASYQPGFDLFSQPGYGESLDRIADISQRRASGTFGNTAGSPTAQAGIFRDVLNEGYNPMLASYRGQLGQFGGLGLNTAGAGSLGGAGVAGGKFDAIGYGLGSAMNPQPKWDDIFKQMGTGQYKTVY